MEVRNAAGAPRVELALEVEEAYSKSLVVVMLLQEAKTLHF